MRELIKTWRHSGFSLRLYDTGTYDDRGCTRLAYCLRDGGKVIFNGEDFCASPMHTDDSLNSVYACLSFLTLKPGDTDDEYFANYTPEQLAWCESDRCQELSMIVMDKEERLDKRRRATQ